MKKISKISPSSESERRQHASDETLALLQDIPNGTHVTAAELFELAQSKGQPISLSSVYRHLATLESRGAVLGIACARGRIYEVSPAEKHHHLICMACGRTTEFVDPILSHLGENMAKEVGFEYLNSRYDIFGFCQNCRPADQYPEQEEIIQNLESAIASFVDTLTSLRHQKKKSGREVLQAAEKRLEQIVDDIAQVIAMLKA